MRGGMRYSRSTEIQPTSHNMTKNPQRVSSFSSVVWQCQLTQRRENDISHRWDRQQRVVKKSDNPSSGSPHGRFSLHRPFPGPNTTSSQGFVVKSVRRVDFPASPLSFADLPVSWERGCKGGIKASHQPLVQHRGSAVQLKPPRECLLRRRDSCPDTVVHDCPNPQELEEKSVTGRNTCEAPKPCRGSPRLCTQRKVHCRRQFEQLSSAE